MARSDSLARFSPSPLRFGPAALLSSLGLVGISSAFFLVAFFVASFFAFAVLAVSATPASALPTGPRFEVLCDGDCPPNPAYPGALGGPGLNFELGVRALEDGLDLIIETEGDVYVTTGGSLRATEGIYLFAPEMRFASGVSIVEAPEIILDDRRDVFVDKPDDGSIVVPRIGTISPGVRPPTTQLPVLPPICACISTTGVSGGSISLLAGDLVEVAGDGTLRSGLGRIEIASGAHSPSGATLVASALVAEHDDGEGLPGIYFSRTGDVFVDLGDVILGVLKIKARGEINFVQTERHQPVPEPTTALLMGLGLAGLTSVRSRASNQFDSASGIQISRGTQRS